MPEKAKQVLKKQYSQTNNCDLFFSAQQSREWQNFLNSLLMIGESAMGSLSFKNRETVVHYNKISKYIFLVKS